MAATPIIKSIIVVLKPSTNNSEFITSAFGVHNSILPAAPNSNPYFNNVTWSVSMADYLTNVTALDTAEKGMTLNPPTHTASDRNGLKKIVKDNLTLLKADVQKAARLIPDQAQVIIESAGMLLKGSSVHIKYVGSKNTAISGTVKTISADAGPHEWGQLSADGLTWISLRATKGGIKTIAGLTPGTKYTFRSSKIVSDGTPENAWVVYNFIIVT